MFNCYNQQPIGKGKNLLHFNVVDERPSTGKRQSLLSNNGERMRVQESLSFKSVCRRHIGYDDSPSP